MKVSSVSAVILGLLASACDGGRAKPAAPPSSEDEVQLAVLDSLYGPDSTRPLSVALSAAHFSAPVPDAPTRPEAIASAFKEIEPGTAAAFAVAARDSSPLLGSLRRQARLRMLTDSVANWHQHTRQGFLAFPKLPRLGYGSGFVKVSHVGFNAERTQAVVGVYLFCGPLCGHGTFYMLTRSPDRRWRIASEYTFIAS